MKFCSESIYLMDPAVVALLNYEEDPEMIFYGLDLKQFEFFLIPINDNSDKMNANGGSHWSLLAYLSEEDIFIYYDSMQTKNNNIGNALKIAGKLRGLIQNESKTALEERFIINPETPQQKNGYDCGVYVLGFTEVLIEFVLKKEKILHNKKMNELIDEKYVEALRIRVKELLVSLIETKNNMNKNG